MPSSPKAPFGRERSRSASKAKSDWRKGVSRELAAAKRLFVLGVGNLQRGDDAAGSLFIRRLEGELARRKSRLAAPAAGPSASRADLKKSSLVDLQVLDGGAAPENVTGVIRGFRPTHVLIVDAAAGGHRPGTIFIMDRDKIREDDISTHRLPLFHLARYLEEDIGCRVILLGIELKAAGPGRPVSREVGAAASRLASWLGRVLPVQRA